MLDCLTVLDFETTGFDPAHHFVTEIGAVRLRGGEVVSQYQTLVDFGGPVPANITDLTGISTEMCARGREPRHAFALLRNLIGTDTVVAHNAPFDIAWLNASYQRYGASQPLASPFLCTALLAQWYLLVGNTALGGPADCKLPTLCAHFGIERGQGHRALDDAKATAVLLGHLFEAAESHCEGWLLAEQDISERFINAKPQPYHGRGSRAVYEAWLPEYAREFVGKGSEA